MKIIAGVDIGNSTTEQPWEHLFKERPIFEYCSHQDYGIKDCRNVVGIK